MQRGRARAELSRAFAKTSEMFDHLSDTSCSSIQCLPSRRTGITHPQCVAQCAPSLCVAQATESTEVNSRGVNRRVVLHHCCCETPQQDVNCTIPPHSRPQKNSRTQSKSHTHHTPHAFAHNRMLPRVIRQGLSTAQVIERHRTSQFAHPKDTCLNTRKQNSGQHTHHMQQEAAHSFPAIVVFSR